MITDEQHTALNELIELFSPHFGYDGLSAHIERVDLDNWLEPILAAERQAGIDSMAEAVEYQKAAAFQSGRDEERNRLLDECLRICDEVFMKSHNQKSYIIVSGIKLALIESLRHE